MSHRSGSDERNSKIIIALVISLSVVGLLYLNARTDLNQSKRWGRFQQYLQACGCTYSGGVEEDGFPLDQYRCAVGGGFTTLRDYAEYVDPVVSYNTDLRRHCPRG